MLDKLKLRFERLQKTLDETISFVQSLDEETLHSKPEGKWSIAQIFQHLHDSERGTVNYLVKKTKAPPQEVESAGIGAQIRSFFLRRALKNNDKKYRAPKVLGEVEDKPDVDTLISAYRETRSEMKELLEKFDGKMINKTYFKHPRAGKLTIGQTLLFLQDHFDRHRHQMNERSKKHG